MNLVYGPVATIKYGEALGINLLGKEKVCSYNCVYCDLGPSLLTMNKIRKELEFPSIEILSAEFKQFIKQSVQIDSLLVSGNGEPTLYPQFDEAMKELQNLRNEHLPNKPIIVLSNGAHLDSRKVILGMNTADERIIKMDAGNDLLANKINEPLVRITVSKQLAGIRKLKDCVVQATFFSGAGMPLTSEQLDEWMEVVGLIKPKEVQLRTFARPSKTREDVSPVDEDFLYSVAFKLKKRTGLEANVFNIGTR